MHALAKERAATERARFVHGAAAVPVEERAATFADERQRPPVLRRDGVATTETTKGLRHERPLEVRDPWLTTGALEVATVRARVAAEAIEASIELRVDARELPEHVGRRNRAASHGTDEPQGARKRKPLGRPRFGDNARRWPLLHCCPMRARRLPVLALSLSLGACATPYFFDAPPRALPPLSVDIAASEVTSEIGDAPYHREVIARLLEDLTARDASIPRTPARFRAVVRGESRYSQLVGSIFYCGVYIGLLTDCSYWHVDRTVELEVEVGGRRFAGGGWASRGASTWFNTSGYHSLKEATENAVRRGIEAGAYSAPAPATEGDPR